MCPALSGDTLHCVCVSWRLDLVPDLSYANDLDHAHCRLPRTGCIAWVAFSLPRLVVNCKSHHHRSWLMHLWGVLFNLKEVLRWKASAHFCYSDHTHMHTYATHPYAYFLSSPSLMGVHKPIKLDGSKWGHASEKCRGSTQLDQL